MEMAVTQVPASMIRPGNNDRTDLNPTKLAELAASIQQNGLAQPITLRRTRAGLEIVAGERRFRAMTELLGWETVPALVRDDLDDEAASAIMLVENTGRQDLNPVEEARAYQARIDRYGWPVERLATVAGVSGDLVKRRLSLLTLRDDVLQLIATGHLSLGHAEALTCLDRNRQLSALRILQEARQPLTLAAFRDIVQQLHAAQQQDALFDLEQFWVAQVQHERLPTRGKRAITGAPTRQDLPPVIEQHHDTVGHIMDRYIRALLATGKPAEAAAIGTLYDALVRKNYVSVPPRATLLTATEVPAA